MKLRRLYLFLIMVFLNLWMIACKGEHRAVSAKEPPGTLPQSVSIQWNIGDIRLCIAEKEQFAVTDDAHLSSLSQDESGTLFIRSPKHSIWRAVGSTLTVILPPSVGLLEIRSDAGCIELCGDIPAEVKIETKTGSVLWECDENAEFLIMTDAIFRCELPVQRIEGGYRCQNGSRRIFFNSKEGEFRIRVGNN